MSSRTVSKPKKPNKYYYKVADTELGPFSSKELKAEAVAGRLSPDCLIRKSGDDRWHSATSIRGLFQDSPKTLTDSGPPDLPIEPVPKKNAVKGLFGLSKKKDAKIAKLIATVLMAAIFVVAGILAIFDEDFRASILPGYPDAHQRTIVDGKTVGEWQKLTKITTSEISGTIYNTVLATLKKYAYRPNSVRMVGGHQVERQWDEFGEEPGSPKYTGYHCKGRFQFKTGLGIEDEMTYLIEFRKYQDGRIGLGDVKIDDRLVQKAGSWPR